MPPAIETEQLTKDFAAGFWRTRPLPALDGLTLSIEPGAAFGFLGPNGAGTTSTRDLPLQLIVPTAGCAAIAGRPPGDLDRRAAPRPRRGSPGP